MGELRLPTLDVLREIGARVKVSMKVDMDDAREIHLAHACGM
jgi:hypothetical protein